MKSNLADLSQKGFTDLFIKPIHNFLARVQDLNGPLFLKRSFCEEEGNVVKALCFFQKSNSTVVILEIFHSITFVRIVFQNRCFLLKYLPILLGCEGFFVKTKFISNSKLFFWVNSMGWITLDNLDFSVKNFLVFKGFKGFYVKNRMYFKITRR